MIKKLYNFKIGMRREQSGYTLLFAVLVSSLVLAIGISILNISKKEFLIATSARDSAAALYAADGGLECGIYADWRGNFNTIEDKTTPFYCILGHTFPDPGGKPVFGSEIGEFVFHVGLGELGASCAVVTVTKAYVEVNDVEMIRTTIESKGYNTGWDGDNKLCNKPSAKRVERALVYSTF